MKIIKSLIIWVVGVILIVLFFPLTFIVWILVLPFDRDRTIMHWMLTCQSYCLTNLMPFWKINIAGREKALKNTPYIIISNHQSILDILIINCLWYRFKWVSKIENIKVPVLGWYIRMAGYITVNRGDKDSKDNMMERSYNYLERGISVMMFPEGTRSVNGKIGFFKRGAFEMAINASIPILPILVDGTGGILPKHGLIFSTGNKIRIRVFDPVQPDSFDTNQPDVLSLRFSKFMSDALREMRAEK